MPRIVRYPEGDKIYDNIKRNGKRRIQRSFKISQGGFTYDEFIDRIRERFKKAWQQGNRKEYTISVIYENLGVRGHRGPPITFNSDIQIYDPSDSNIEREDAGNIIGFYLFEWE